MARVDTTQIQATSVLRAVMVSLLRQSVVSVEAKLAICR
jgi:hypothetical protein